MRVTYKSPINNLSQSVGYDITKAVEHSLSSSPYGYKTKELQTRMLSRLIDSLVDNKMIDAKQLAYILGSDYEVEE